MKNKILIVTLASLLVLTGCNTGTKDTKDASTQTETTTTDASTQTENTTTETNTESNTETNTNSETSALSAEDVLQKYKEKYSEFGLTKFDYEIKENQEIYELEGYNNNQEVEFDINATTGEIIKEKTENSDPKDAEIFKEEFVSKINDLVSDAIIKADGTFELKSYNLELEHGVPTLEIELKDTDNKEVEYKYNIETSELIKQN